MRVAAKARLAALDGTAEGRCSHIGPSHIGYENLWLLLPGLAVIWGGPDFGG